VVITRVDDDPTQVHMQIAISQYSNIEISREFIGRALAQFERSTLPEHKDTRTVVLRILKLITPVNCVIPEYDGHVCSPKEGELFQRYTGNVKRKLRVWSLNIDKPSVKVVRRGLQLLWDV
jgi:hypothetical protein